MVQINFAQKEIQCKVVYYGPGMSGKTTNLELVHGKVPADHRGELTSIATTGERTLYFDYMPLDLGQIAGIRTKFQLYTVPGQIYYKSTRRLVLQGVDGIVFVADSSPAKLKENQESLADLEENLKEMGKSLKDIPLVIQYNKRDLPDAMPVEELERALNPHGFPSTEAVAMRGDGVFPTLKQLAGMVLEAVNKGGLAAPKARSVARPARVSLPSESTAQGPRPDLSLSSSGSVSASGAYRLGGMGVSSSVASRLVAPPAPAASPTPPRGPGPAPAPVPAPPVAVPAGEPAAALPERRFEDRVVSVSGLGQGTASRTLMLLGLGALIACAMFFVVTRVL